MKFIGTPEQIADRIEEWAIESDVDGFNIAQTYSPETFREFVDLLCLNYRNAAFTGRNMKERH